MHYVTTRCLYESVQTFHDPPLMLHIDQDPNDLTYITARADVVERQRTLQSVPYQKVMGNDPKLAICCDRNAGSA